MNILKTLTVLAIFIPSMVFAHTDVTSTSSNEASSVEVDEEGTAGDTENKSSEESDTVFCTEDAKVCADGSSVGRVGPDCEFAECSEEDVEDKTENEMDSEDVEDGVVEEETSSSGDSENLDVEGAIDESGNEIVEDGDITDSFFDVFVDLNDEETKMALDSFLKLEGIDGESVDVNINNDGYGNSTTSNNDSDKYLDGKSKEIVVDGNKVRKEVQDGKVVVRGWDGDKKEMTISPEDILKGEDFLDFVGATVLSDANIESVSLDLGKTTMKYEQPAKLFGFIPVNLVALVELSGKDKVNIKFPWYTFFTKNNTEKVKKEIDVLSLSWGASQSKKEDTDLQDRARKLQSISDVMKTVHDVTIENI